MSLISRADLKTRIQVNVTDDDAYFDIIIAQVDKIVDGVVGRPVEQSTYVEYYDGTGHRLLPLSNGPVDTGANLSVGLVTYDNAGAESVDWYTLNSDYFVRGELDQGWRLPSTLVSATVWLTGRRNWKVAYTAGYNASDGIPGDIQAAAMHAATWLWDKRLDAGTLSRDIGDGGVSYRDEMDLFDDLRRYLSTYRAL